MSTKTRLIIFSLAAITGLGVNLFFDNVINPPIAAEVAVNQLEDSEVNAAAARSYGQLVIFVPTVTWICLFLLAIFLFFKEPEKTMKLGLMLCGIFTLSSVGCMRPVDVPEFVEIEHHQTGYVIPYEGANKSNQAKFESKEALQQNKIATKRVQIQHKWIQTGRWWLPTAGYYQDIVRIVVVDRTPVTREWTADDDSGTTNTDEAIWLESKDSIGFSLGFNCTGFVDEQDTSTFLYWYPTAKPKGSEDVDISVAQLDHVMDKEIRARVQMLANTIAARYDLDDLRSKKSEILHAVRNGVSEIQDKDGKITQEKLIGTVQHFLDRGVTITNLGQFGGFAYEEPAIQTAINETFIAQQEKVRTEASFEAQQKINEKIELAAKADAERARTIAQGEADAITMIAKATKEAGKDPLFLQLKQLEVEESRIKTWNGQYPTTMMNMGEGNTPALLLDLKMKE